MTDKRITFADIENRLPNLAKANLYGADLSEAYLRGADLREADLSGAILCGAIIDGAIVSPNGIGGPGHILCALTDDEWSLIKKGRDDD